MSKIGLLLQALKHLKIGGKLPGGHQIPDNALTRSFESSLQLFQSTGTVLSTWRLLRLALFPIALGFVAFIIAFILLFFLYYDQVVATVLGKYLAGFLKGSSGNTLALLGSAATGFIMFILSILLSALAGFFAMNGFGVFFFEQMALEGFYEQKLLKKEIVEKQGGSLLVQTRLMLGELVRLVLVALIAVAAIIIGIIPIFSIFSAAILAALFGYEFVDLAMSVLHLSMRQRIRLTLQHLPQVLGIGMMFTFLLAVPFGIILFYPIAAHAGAIVVSKWKLPRAGRLKDVHYEPLKLELEI